MEPQDTHDPRDSPTPDLREHILGQTKLPVRPVHAFGRKCYVRTMTGAERDAYEAEIVEAAKAGRAPNYRGSLAARTLSDAQGNRLFTDDDADALAKLSARDLDRIFDLATELNGLGADAIEELEGNSAPTTGGDSSSS